jgi:DNA-binding CsgD family transcriptional regulator
MTSTATSLVARDEELSRLRQLVAPLYDRSRVFLILGDPGAGKTVLLAERALALVEPAPRLDQLAARAVASSLSPVTRNRTSRQAWPIRPGTRGPSSGLSFSFDYGQWLRRQRRINDAERALGAALETLRRLGAAPWTDRAEAELRACGVTAQAPSSAPGRLDGLTSQQREIAALAARGLTNGEIADRMFLSPRTVASHLYRSYPKLGIAGRHQLRDIIEHAGLIH